MSVKDDNTYTQYEHKLCSGSTHLSYGGGSGPIRLLVLHSSVNRLCEASAEVVLTVLYCISLQIFACKAVSLVLCINYSRE
jgi:hypothetical protein